jgi:hypothetical protein
LAVSPWTIRELIGNGTPLHIHIGEGSYVYDHGAVRGTLCARTGAREEVTGELTMGSLYKRGNTWWVKYYQHGGPIREGSRTAKETEARRFLKLREGQVAQGKEVILRAEPLRFEELAADLMFNLALQQTPPKGNQKPYIPRLREDNVRTGFSEADAFLAMLMQLPADLQPMASLPMSRAGAKRRSSR